MVGCAYEITLYECMRKSNLFVVRPYEGKGDFVIPLYLRFYIRPSSLTQLIPGSGRTPQDQSIGSH